MVANIGYFKMKKILLSIFIILFLYVPVQASHLRQLNEIGTSQGRAFTRTMYVWEDGTGQNGNTWTTAYKTIPSVLNACSTDGSDITLVYISTPEIEYDMDTTGDPTWSANVELRGSYRNFTKIVNNHAGATSILKLMGKSAVRDLNFNLGTSNNGLTMTHGGARVNLCQFVGEDLTSAAIALEINNGTTIKHIKSIDNDFLGDGTYMTALKLDNVAFSHFERFRVHECDVGVCIVDVSSDSNLFHKMDIGDCNVGFDIYAGNEQHLDQCIFHHNTVDISDDVGDHTFAGLVGAFGNIILPDNFVGVDLDASTDGGNVWGENVEILSAASRTTPFSVLGVVVEADATEQFRVRLSADGGVTHFMDIPVRGTANTPQRAAVPLPSGTDRIFNQNIQISGSCKSETGSNTATVWIELQEI
jgi:hypothetical protein